MRRPLGRLLDSVSAQVLGLTADLPDSAPTLAMMASLVAMIAADADDYIADRLGDAEQIRAFLHRARNVLPADRQQALDMALAWSPSRPDDYRRGRIEEHLAALQRALIEVHVCLEHATSTASEALLDELWRMLKAQADSASRLVTSLW